MKLYNTLSRQVEEIRPIKPPVVTIYTCGPTVYDYPHIGNWFTFIRYDLLIRILKTNGLNPKWVMNVTDVGHLVSDADAGEDKLEKGARREGKSAWSIAKFYSDYFETALVRLNFTKPDCLPKATDHISEQVDLVKQLEGKGYTYSIDDGIYFDTSKFPSYSSFARLDLDEQEAGKRVDYNPQKRNSSDFALWKYSPKNSRRDMEWDSPWGKGFPGWHLECSAMCNKYLGATIDIHSGGIDHVPVHHTNEIAQSQAATDQPLANYWMHTNHIMVNNQKIAKSAGNGITLEDIEKKGYGLSAFRLHVLESHYRSQSKFSWESLAASSTRLNNWQMIADLRFQTSSQASLVKFDTGVILAELTNDLNTPQALAAIDETFNMISGKLLDTDLAAFEKYLSDIDKALGINLLDSLDIEKDQKLLIEEREHARFNKQWARSDELRNDLSSQGIGLNDTALGAVWYRI